MKKLLPLAVGMAACLLAAIPATAQSLIGAWTYGDTSSPTSTGTGVFVFLSNGAYFHAESDNTDDGANGMDGVERGTYSYNDGTGTFTFNSNAVNTNGGWGLSDMTPGDTLAIDISGDTFSVDGGGYDFTRVTGSNNLIGAWTFGDSLNPDANGTGVIVFMENLVYFHIETDNTDVDGMNGMERGTYTWNQITGAFSSTQAVDTNGQWGIVRHLFGHACQCHGQYLECHGYRRTRFRHFLSQQGLSRA